MDRDVDFGTLQAIADLRAIAALGVGGTASRIAPGAAASVEALIHRHGCRIGDDERTLALLEPLERAAATPDPGPDSSAFVTATAILLADSLQGGVDPAGLVLNYELHEPRYRAAPNPFRAALLNGFEALAGQLPRRPFPSPPPSDRCSTDRDAIIRELIVIARSAPDEELIAISQSDYGCGAEAHLTALHRVIGEQECRMVPGQSWYPSEVVELAAHVPDNRGFLCATTLLMIAALEDQDSMGNMEFRWENNARTYLALAPNAAEPVLAGFRHLYETVENWSPYFTALFSPEEHRAVLIPLAARRFLSGGEGIAEGWKS